MVEPVIPPSISEENPAAPAEGEEQPVKVRPVTLEAARRLRHPPAEAPPGAPPPYGFSPSEPAPPPALGPAAPPPEPPPDLARVLRRVESLEETVASLESRRPAEPAEAQIRDLQANLRGLADQLKALSARLEQLSALTSGTIGAGARDNFVCPACRARGQVATRVTCAACGSETWWGFWQPRQD